MRSKFTDTLFAAGMIVCLYAAMFNQNIWIMYAGIMLADSALVVAAWRWH